jgi:REP element-mobilizing transposase RayT
MSHTNLLYHIVFSTKNREPCLEPGMRPRLFEYLGGAVRGEGGTALAINGVADHVHLLVRLRQDKAVSAVVGAIKANSSGWVHRTFPACAGFAWQVGYGAFTVSTSQTGKVRRYIEDQEEHHRVRRFQEEFLAFLKANGIEYDHRYIWD